LLSAVLFVSLFALMSGSALAAPAVTLKFAGQSPADHPASILMNEIAKEVAQKTNGRIEIKVYPANQLGDYTLVYEELIKGTIDMSCTSVPSQFDLGTEIRTTN
jgi:TRAP-type C4-dicarboxylate transport system substrate-binding protein